jgi:hypothetical protein
MCRDLDQYSGLRQASRLTAIRMKTPRTAAREINPDSAVKARPILCPRVKQEMLVPVCASACSSGVQIDPFRVDMMAICNTMAGGFESVG